MPDSSENLADGEEYTNTTSGAQRLCFSAYALIQAWRTLSAQEIEKYHASENQIAGEELLNLVRSWEDYGNRYVTLSEYGGGGLAGTLAGQEPKMLLRWTEPFGLSMPGFRKICVWCRRLSGRVRVTAVFADDQGKAMEFRSDCSNEQRSGNQTSKGFLKFMTIQQYFVSQVYQVDQYICSSSSISRQRLWNQPTEVTSCALDANWELQKIVQQYLQESVSEFIWDGKFLKQKCIQIDSQVVKPLIWREKDIWYLAL